MNMKTMDSIKTSNAAPRENLMEDLRSVMADAEELLRATANQTGKRAAATRARIQANLQVVKESMVTAETAVVERTRQAAKVTDQYVHDNAWNWH